jgi:DNA-binding MarR family transcriptional regulator
VAGQRKFQLAMARDRSNPMFSVNLTMSQLKIVLALRLHGPAGGQELAHMMGVSLATMTGIVDRLVSGGYVTRREDPKDRRVRRVELTDSGADLMDRLVTAGEAHQRKLLERLKVDELTVVADAMEILLRVLDEMAEEEEG